MNMVMVECGSCHVRGEVCGACGSPVLQGVWDAPAPARLAPDELAALDALIGGGLLAPAATRWRSGRGTPATTR